MTKRRTIRLGFVGGGGGPNKRGSDLVKPQYLGKPVELDYDDRTALVRFFMNIFQERKYGQYDVKRIKQFLKRFHLTKAEIHAIIFHLGYRYKQPKEFGNMMINGYYDNPK